VNYDQLLTFLDKQIPSKLRQEEDLYEKARQIIYICIIAPVFLLIFFGIGIFIGLPYSPWVCLAAIPVLMAIFAFFRKSALLHTTVHWLAAEAMLIILSSILETGGLHSQAVNWLIVPAMLSFLYSNRKTGFIWTIIGAFILTILFLANWQAIQFVDVLNANLKPFHDFYISFLLFGFIVSVILAYAVEVKKAKIIKSQNHALELANEELHSQKDLLNSLNEKLSDKSTDLENKNLELEKIYRQVTDSITYASRIQLVLLPSKELFEGFSKDYFILYRPKNIVSGDFYWISILEGFRFLVVADCTGHGVSGAFMTVIGKMLLNQIINEKKMLVPKQILEQLDKALFRILNQQANRSFIADGMDMGLVRYEDATQKLIFCSANRPIIFSRNGIIDEVKANKSSIGGQPLADKHFEDYSMDCQHQEVFYLFTDGITDQFGGEQNRKFMIRRLREKLQECANLPLAEQQDFLSETLDDWQADNTQTDDILLIGFRCN